MNCKQSANFEPNVNKTGIEELPGTMWVFSSNIITAAAFWALVAGMPVLESKKASVS